MWLVLVVLFTGSMVYGADPCPTCETAIILDDISGGLNTTLPAYKIPSFSPRMRNVFIDNGKIEMINGLDVAGSTNVLGGITGIFPFVLETGKSSFLVTDSSMILETSDFGSYVFVSSGLNTAVLTRCLQVRNKMWCSNGVDSVFTWDGTSKVNLDGTNGTPDVPQFKYMCYWQNRVFGLNTASNGSSLDWSEVKSTAGVQIAPDHYLAWPSGNNLSVGRGDGQVGTGQWVSDGQLNVGKENSIYTIFGTNSSSFFDRKTVADVGINSHDSITVLDGRTYYAGQNGFYENSSRISDSIIPDIALVQKETSKTIRTLWESQSDFGAGNMFNGSTATPSGLLTLRTDSLYANNNRSAEPTSVPVYTLNSSNNSFDGNLLSTNTIPYGFFGYVHSVDFWGRCSNSACPIQITVKNLRTNTSVILTKTIPVTSNYIRITSTVGVDDNGNKPLYDKYELDNGTMNVAIARGQPYTTEVFEFYSATTAGQSTIFMLSGTTAQFVSEVATLTSITSWGNFDSVNNTNNGRLEFFIRTSTSSVNITTQTWSSIVPGVRISAPIINNYAQWASTMVSASTQNHVNVDNVSIDHIEGAGSANRPFGIEWNNRWWVEVATDTSGKFSKIYVKSRITNKNPYAWMPIEGINIRSFAKDGSRTLYGGAASTGVVYRLDYGTNFDGQAINPVYETPDIYMGAPFDEKSLWEYLLIADKESGNNLTLGFSIDGGAFTDTTISLDGSGRLIKTIQNVTGIGKYFRWRFANNQTDKRLSVTNFAVTYRPTRIRKGIND